MRIRSAALFGGSAAALAVLALLAGVVALAGERQADAVSVQSGSASLGAGVSSHSPCGDPIWLKARLKDDAGHGVTGVAVTFSYRLTSGTVLRHARTDVKGLARVSLTPRPATAPQGVRVTVRAKAVYDGVTLRAATWFTPGYS